MALRMQYWANALRQFCSLVFDRDSIIKSSAYKREFNLVLLGKTNGSDRILSKEKGKSLMYRLNRSGLRMQPWRTLLAYWKGRVWLLPLLIEPVEL